MSASDADYSTLPGRQANRLHVEDPFLPRNLNCVLSPENEEGCGRIPFFACESWDFQRLEMPRKFDDLCAEEFLKQRLEHAAMTIQQQGVPEAFLQVSLVHLGLKPDVEGKLKKDEERPLFIRPS